MGASNEWAAGRSVALLEGAAGFPALCPTSGQGLQTSGRLVGVLLGS